MPDILLEFAKDIFILEGPSVPFFGIPHPHTTTPSPSSVIIKLQSGDGCFVWSPTELPEEAAKEIEEKAGDVVFLVAPNKIHHIFLKQWSERYPDAKVLAAPGLKGRNAVKGVRIDGDLTDNADGRYADDIDQVVFGGSCFMDEVVFYHKSSGKTAEERELGKWISTIRNPSAGSMVLDHRRRMFLRAINFRWTGNRQGTYQWFPDNWEERWEELIEAEAEAEAEDENENETDNNGETD